MTLFPAKSRVELRKFGFVMTVPLAAITAWLLWKGKGSYPYLGAASAFFLLSALLAPTVLRPIEFVWMKLAALLGAVMTRVILTLAFILVITPLGLLLRIMKKDLLDTREAGRRDSYWHPVEPDGPSSRSDKPY